MHKAGSAVDKNYRCREIIGRTAIHKEFYASKFNALAKRDLANASVVDINHIVAKCLSEAAHHSCINAFISEFVHPLRHNHIFALVATLVIVYD